jgi:hypothetical protein
MVAITEDELNSALEIVDITYDGVGSPVEIAGRARFGDLIPLGDDETQQLTALRDLVARFLGQAEPARPLCLAVFGPPGSGKSFSVQQVQAEVKKALKVDLPTTTINLTQIADAVELAGGLRSALNVKEGVPLVFFDEFDTTRDGAAYGWLSWFLSPMHDGEFFHAGENVKRKRAIYVFAGGTASTMSEFTDRQADPVFRSAKGPDFVSRLRGFLDVPGPNANKREMRRAVILRATLPRH